MAVFRNITNLTTKYGRAGKRAIKSVRKAGVKGNVEAAKKVAAEVKSTTKTLFNNRADKLNRKVALQNAKDTSPLNRKLGVKNPLQQPGRDFATSHFRPYNTVEPSLTNAFTGYEMKAGVDTALAGGVMAFAAGTAAVRGAYMDDNKPTRAPEQVGSMQGLSYDGVANTANGRRDLGATGDLVFGLHNSRRR